jgi:iron complex transport system substrate-binding protein
MIFRRKKILRKIAAVLVFIIVFALTGCDNRHYTEYGGEITSITGPEAEALRESQILQDEQDRKERREAEISREALTATSARVIDRLGQEVEVPEEVSRIVSTTPAITEILAGLGLADRIVAADMFSRGIPGMPDSVCTLDMMHINPQEIADLSPDIVIIGEISGGDYRYALESMGIYTVYLPTAKSIEAIKMDIEFLAVLTGTQDAGAELISEMNTDMLYAEELVAGFAPKTVYFEISEQPNIFTIGENTFLTDALRIAGAETVFWDRDGYIKVSTDEILERADEIDIVFTTVSYEGYNPQEIFDREGFENIKALKEGLLYPLDTDAFSRPSQNITKAIRSLALMVHPEAIVSE